MSANDTQVLAGELTKLIESFGSASRSSHCPPELLRRCYWIRRVWQELERRVSRVIAHIRSIDANRKPWRALVEGFRYGKSDEFLESAYSIRHTIHKMEYQLERLPEDAEQDFSLYVKGTFGLARRIRKSRDIDGVFKTASSDLENIDNAMEREFCLELLAFVKNIVHNPGMKSVMSLIHYVSPICSNFLSNGSRGVKKPKKEARHRSDEDETRSVIDWAKSECSAGSHRSGGSRNSDGSRHPDAVSRHSDGSHRRQTDDAHHSHRSDGPDAAKQSNVSHRSGRSDGTHHSRHSGASGQPDAVNQSNVSHNSGGASRSHASSRHSGRSQRSGNSHRRQPDDTNHSHRSGGPGQPDATNQSNASRRSHRTHRSHRSGGSGR